MVVREIPYNVLSRTIFQNLPVVCSAFNLIIIRTAQHRVEDMDIEQIQQKMVFEDPKANEYDTVLDIRKRFSAINFIEQV